MLIDWQDIDSASRRRQVLPKFDYLKAASLDQAVDLLNDYGPQARVLAGGTDILIAMSDGLISPQYLVDIKGIPELSVIHVDSRGDLRIGACVTVNRLAEFTGIPRGMDAIREAASLLATYQIRNRATVGGNLCNASPACDLGPPLLVLDARLRVISKQGERLIPLKDFFTGVKTTCCGPCEVITEILVPSDKVGASAFLKRTRIRGHDLAIVNGAAAVGDSGGHGGGLRLALGAVAPMPLLLDGFDGVGLDERGGIIEAARESISPIDDVRGSSRYRRYMVDYLVERLLDILTQRTGQT